MDSAAGAGRRSIHRRSRFQLQPPGAPANLQIGKTIIAGYHWFSDWGRDTMIALPGLCLTTRRYDCGEDDPQDVCGLCRSRACCPIAFPIKVSSPEYNTVDATLWYFHAIDAVAEATGDWSLVRELYPVLKDIIAWHVKGTRYQIHVDADGLLYAGEPGVQLTWMDAKVDDWVVTPRIGKPVEINALWIHALRLMAKFAQQLGHAEEAAAYLAAGRASAAEFSAALLVRRGRLSVRCDRWAGRQ